MRTTECRTVTHDGGMRHQMIMFGFDDQYVAGKVGAGGKGAIFFRGNRGAAIDGQVLAVQLALGYRPFGIAVQGRHARSEEHTSELQSLMRISYAVFCLKKKKSHRSTYSADMTSRHTKPIT